MTFSNSGSFFDSQPMFVCDQQTLEIRDVNAAATGVLGYSRRKFLGSRIADFVTDCEKLKDAESVRDDLPENLVCMVTKSGKARYFQLSASLISYRSRPAKMVIAHDMTPEINKSVFKKVLSRPLDLGNAPLAEIEWDASLNIIQWSAKASAVFGWTETEALKEADLLKKIVHEEDIEQLQAKIKKGIRDHSPQVTVLIRNRTAAGEMIYCEWYNTLLYDENNRVSSVYSMIHEVTGREIAIENAHKSMMSYQDLFNSISDAIYLINYQGEVVEVNEGLESTFGYERSDIIGEHVKKLSAPGKFREDWIEHITALAESGNSEMIRGWGRKANGEVFPTELLVNSGTYFGQKVIIMIERDISERVNQEEILKKREGLLSKLFGSSPIGVALLNKHKEVEMVNEGFEAMFGWTEEELRGLVLDRVIVTKKQHKEAMKLSESESVLQKTAKRVTKDGRMIDVIIYGVPVVVDDEVVGIYGLYVDITEREKAEAQVKKSLKEKEILLAEIHHRVKNNLAVITGLLELQSYSVESETARRTLKDSQMRVNSIALVHEKLYQSESFSEIALDQYFSELTDEIHRSMKRDDLEVTIALDIDTVQISITQAIPCGLLMNEIITNSFKHAFTGRSEGKISISLKEVCERKLELIIKDDGTGMDEQEERDVKSSLGMTLIKTLARQLGAEFRYENNRGMQYSFLFAREFEEEAQVEMA